VTYAHSSVIVKRYYAEPGTERVLERLAAAERVFTSRLAYAEVHAALARKRRERAVSEAVYRRAASAFESDWLAYDQIALDTITLGAVARLVRSTHCAERTRFTSRQRSGFESTPAIRSSCGRRTTDSWTPPGASASSP
jgi:predicted nucleic acid-binding protein